MTDRILLGLLLVALIVATASLAQTFVLTIAVTDQNGHIDQLASQFGDLAGIVSSLIPKQNASPAQSNVVYLYVVPDFGGSTYDAFVLPQSFSGNTPNASSHSNTAPDNNITVTHGVPIKFIISNIDTAILQNFTNQVSTPFTIYNDTASGQVAIQYTQGETVSKLPISHTFTVPDLQIDIPIPPDTMVVFTYTFNTPGVYSYLCTTPCGPGMGLAGYMLGYITVT